MPTSQPNPLKVVVTGAAGSLGTIMASHLVSSGYDVVGIDRVFRNGLTFPLRVADLLDRESVYHELSGADAILHLGNHPNAYGRDAQTTINENVAMNTHVFQAAAELGVPKILFASTVQVLSGDRRADERADRKSRLAYLPIDSALPPIPENAYGLSKQLAENMLSYYARNTGLSAVAIRFPFVTTNARVLRHFAEVHDHYHLDEAFSYLTSEDGATFVEAILKADLPGFRIYFPASHGNLLNRNPQELIREFFPEVPLKKPLEQINSLVDTSDIQRETGWRPTS